jgi:hypothetical protein
LYSSFIVRRFSMIPLLSFRCRLLVVAACVLCSTLSCAGPQGAQGPAGPQGAQGQQGVPGSAAASATVVNITVPVSSWRAAGVGSPGALLQSGWFNSANITSGIMASGAVLVYYQVNSAPVVWQQLPITYYGSGVFQVIDVQYQQGQVQFFLNQSNSNAPPLPNSSLTFRVVAIPGITVAALKAQMDVSDFAVVQRAFNIVN